MLNYCPVARAYPRGGDCTDGGSAPRGGYAGGSQARCAACRCFGSRDDATRGSSRPTCHETRCLNASTLEVRKYGRWHRCPADGGTLTVGVELEGNAPGSTGYDFYSGGDSAILCPNAEELCRYDDAIWPQFDRISPISGPVKGGIAVTLIGANLDAMTPPVSDPAPHPTRPHTQCHVPIHHGAGATRAWSA